MPDSPSVIRTIACRELFPWLILLRTFKIAISPALLALATVAVLIMPLGWWLAGLAFLTANQREAQPAGSQLAAAIPPEVLAYLPSGIRTTVLDAYLQITEPLARLFRVELTLGESAYYLFGFLWTLAVWAFPGGVITRKAIVQLATDEPAGVRDAALFVAQRYRWYLLTPLYPMLVIALVAFPMAGLGLLLQLSLGFGALVAGLFWIFVVLASLVAMWLIGGLLFGWPLMWPTISAERDGDPLEAFSRSYSYIYGKPLHYFFYVVVAAAFGALCWAVVWSAAVLVREFGFWALSWGGEAQAVSDLRLQALDVAAREINWRNEFSMWNFGTTIIGLF